MSFQLRRLVVLAVAGAVAQSASGKTRANHRPVDAALASLTPAVQVAGRDYRGVPLAEMMRRHHVPAVSIALIEKGRIVWKHAYGFADVASAHPASTTTLFQAGSLSKPISATGALALVDRGLLRLDTPVNTMLVRWQVPENDLTRRRPVTLRHLLTHTAGLTVHGFPGYQVGAPLPTLEQILDGSPPANSPAVRVDQQPGTVWRYSGGGFTVLQQLLSDVTSRPFPKLLDGLVLLPTGMSHSHFGRLPEAASDNAASGYRADGTAVPGRYHLYPELAAAGLWTTPTDLARWAIALGGAYRGDRTGPIKHQTAQMMLRPGLGNWGLGVSVRGEGDWLAFDHSGSTEGFNAQVLAFPMRRDGIVVMTNGDDGAAVVDAVVQAVGRTRGWPGSDPRMITATAVSRHELAQLAGRYSDGKISASISLHDGSLFAVVDGHSPIELVPQGADTFITLEGETRVTFRKNAKNGRAASLSTDNLTLLRSP